MDAVTDAQLQQAFGNIQQLFAQADVDKDGVISPKEAKDFFPKFAPVAVLRDLWTKCVSNQAGGMSKAEFVNAMKFIYATRTPSPSPVGAQLPPQPALIPQVTAPSPTPVGLPPSASISGSADPWIMLPADRQNYEGHFNNLAQGGKVVSGANARQFFLNSGLDTDTLRAIWLLSDMDNDGNLDINEFCVAFHLIRVKVKNPVLQIPAQLPQHLLPSNAKRPVTPLQPMPVNNVPPQYISSGAPKRPGDNDVQTLLAQSKALSSDMFAIQQHMQQQAGNAEDLHKQEAQIKEEIDKTRQELNKLRQDRNMLDAQVSSQQARYEILKQDKENFEKDAGQIKDEITRLTEVLKQGEENRQKLESTFSQSSAQFQAQYQELLNLKEKIVEMKSQYDSITNDKGESTKQSENIKNELYALQEQKRQLSSEIATAESQLKSLQSQQGEFRKAIDQTNAELNNLNRQKQDLQQKLSAAQADLAKKPQNTPGDKAKTTKLAQVLKKIEELFIEYNTVSQQDSKTFAAAEPPKLPTPVVSPQSPQISAVTPQQKPLPQQPAPAPVSKPVLPPAPKQQAPAPSAGDFGFDDGFGDAFGSDSGFGAPAPAPAPAPVQQPAPVKQQLPPVPVIAQQAKPQTPVQAKPEPPKPAADFGFDDGFSGGFGDNSKAFDTFSSNNSSVTTQANFDDWGFDAPAAPKPAPAVQQQQAKPEPPKPAASGFDDWGFDSAPAPTNAAPKQQPPASTGFDDDFGF